MMKKILDSRAIREGEIIPPAYGVAYYDYISRQAICYPLPLNVIVRVVREIYYALQRGLFPSRHEKQMQWVYGLGLQDGLNRGELRAYKDLIKRKGL